MKIYRLIILFLILLASCSDTEVIPKPTAQLRLSYPEAEYHRVDFPYFSLEKSDLAKVERVSNEKINLHYPQIKAKIYLTYNRVDNNLRALIRDAEKFTYEHTVKADEILTRDFINDKDKVFATLNHVTGNAASQIQFHATDSSNNFLTGSLYFYAHPNYDSIMPAVHYLKKDVFRLLESLRWKKE
jgi:gliding motility-associated lipoprotein GldD